MTTDLKTQRLNMVESQIRTNEVTDRRILDAMMDIDRENFVPAADRALAYMEGEISVQTGEEDGCRRTLLNPMVLAKLIQLADIKETDLVLDVGCTTGYSTALLTYLTNSVVGLEQGAKLVEKASANLASANIINAAIVEGPLNQGYSAEGPYDVILLNGRVNEPPETLLKQLKPGGRVVGVLGEGVTGKAKIWLNSATGWTSREAFDAAASDLPGFDKDRQFTF